MMSDYQDDNPFDVFEDDEEEEIYDEGEGQEAQGGSNRTFLIAMGIIAAIFLVALIGLGIFAAVILPQRSAARAEQAAAIFAQNTATAVAATQAELVYRESLIQTATQAAIIAKQVLDATPTPVVVLSSATPEQEGGVGSPQDELQGRTATLAVLLTQAAAGQATDSDQASGQVGGEPPGGAATATALPQTGFFDEAGIPVSVGIALMLVVVIFFVRRMRYHST